MKDKGIWLPLEIIHDTNLTWLERVVLMEINQLSMLDKGCVAHNEHFATLFKIRKESTSRVISSLVAKNYITVSISNRNHNRTITINKMLLGGKQNVIDPLTKCLESKENKTMNKTSIYKDWIKELKTKSKIKSKITITKDGEKIFKTIEDKKMLMSDYIQHQNKEGKFAQRITAFMEDYNTVYNQKEDYSQWSM